MLSKSLGSVLRPELQKVAASFVVWITYSFQNGPLTVPGASLGYSSVHPRLKLYEGHEVRRCQAGHLWV